MAFDKAPAAAGNNATGNNIPANKKATAYLNFYMPTENGGKRKLGNIGIVLRENNEDEKKLADWLAVDPEARAKLLMSKLIIEFNSAERAEGSGFVLPE